MPLLPAQPVSPLLALAGFALLSAVLALLCWPRRGLISRALRLFRMTERVWLEDALKQIRQMEEGEHPASVDSLAGALAVGRGHAMRLVERLADRGLALSRGWAALPHLERPGTTRCGWYAPTGCWSATWPTGRGWRRPSGTRRRSAGSTRCLTPRRRRSPPPWVTRATIPTATRSPPSPASCPARSAGRCRCSRRARRSRCIHLEDEPREPFERLLALGLRPGARLRLLAAGPQEARFRFDGREHDAARRWWPIRSPPSPSPPARPLDERAHATLADLRPGESARVVRIAAACQGPPRRRLLDLGVVPGTVITAEFASPGGDPAAYRHPRARSSRCGGRRRA